MENGRVVALCVSEGFIKRLDQIVTKCAHFISFHVALSEVASAETVRRSFGVMAVFAAFA